MRWCGGKQGECITTILKYLLYSGWFITICCQTTGQSHYKSYLITLNGGGRDRMVVEFTTTCAIGAYHHQSCEFESYSWRIVLDTSDKVC
jgi:hypothetical protein